MSRTNAILRNIASNWAGFAVQAAVVFFLTPFVLESLGKERYAIWVLATSLTGYYGLLAFGLQGSVTQFLTRHLASGDYGKMNASASTAFVALGGVSLLLAGVTVVAAFVLPHVVQVSPQFNKELFLVVLVVGFSTAIQFGLFIFSATFVATQRFDLANLIGIATRLLSAGLIWGAISWGHGLVGVSLAMAASDLLGYAVRCVVAYRLIPQLRVSPSLANRDSLGELLTYGTWTFLISIAETIYMHVSALIVGIFMPLAAITYYALAAGLAQHLENLIRPIGRVFFPAVTELHAQGKTELLKKVYLTGSRALFVITLTSAVLAAFFAKDFIRLWVGEDYVSGTEYPSVALLTYFLLAAVVSRQYTNLGGQILQGSLRIRAIAILGIAEAIVSLVLSIVLIPKWGLMGVAFAPFVSIVLFRSLVVPLLLARQLDTPWLQFVTYVSLRPLLVVGVVLIPAVLIRHFLIPNTMLILMLQGALVGILAVPPMVYIGLNRAERDQLVLDPLFSLMTRVGLGISRAKAAGEEQ